ncbi:MULTISPECIES: hypothetical protein [Pseudomonas]|uniref:hypothetical protein n=1 Tax=Pseudomonas TaxID=286 RepID=UPI0010C0BB0E|nr:MULTISPECIES: hypothetical protein [Pseudomonas]
MANNLACNCEMKVEHKPLIAKWHFTPPINNKLSRYNQLGKLKSFRTLWATTKTTVEVISPPHETRILIFRSFGKRNISEASATPLLTKTPGIIMHICGQADAQHFT